MKGSAAFIRLSVTLAFLALGAWAQAEAPLAIAAPKKARAAIVNAARTYMGVPYLYGGASREGLDCSGLVWRVYIDSFGRAPLASMPRTAKELFSFVEVEDRAKLQPGDLVFFNTTAKLSHVGIYSGEGRFIHAASDGTKTGVIESSLSESYWSSHYAASGRILPPAEYLGLYLSASLGPDMSNSFGFHGLSSVVGLSYPVFAGEIGLQLRPSWNADLGIGRLPLVLYLSLDRKLGVFAGPALTLGSPSKDGETYTPTGSFLATAGLVWTPVKFHVAGLDMNLYTQIVYDRYLDASGTGATGDGLSAGAGIGFRMGF